MCACVTHTDPQPPSTMKKKPGEISSNTLNLRFMQTAAKARQEREIEDAKKKVKTEEEWELTPELRERWGVDRQADDQAVSYEPSYLPFVFPGFPSSSKHTIPAGRVKPEADESHEDGECVDEMEVVSYKGRRKFGKYGKEQTEEYAMPAPAPQPSQDKKLAQRAKTISSHGRAAAGSSSMPPPPPSTSTQEDKLPRGARSMSSSGPGAASSSLKARESHSSLQRGVATPIPHSSTPPKPAPLLTQGFMKPDVALPRKFAGRAARKRPIVAVLSMPDESHISEEQSRASKRTKKEEE
ncbi:hypothetical protein JB92DRAFT_348177 [Gautieria morchelliformis]|nr:hypothetical protein JB92DRAFT_348177 [Gautieria morchelliformis]